MGLLATLNEDKEKWYIVWPFYSSIFGAMALYVFHDVIDDRWRRRTTSFLWFCAYLFLNAMFVPACALYFIFQLSGSDLDHREAATTMIAVFVNFFTFRKVIRGFMAFEVTAVIAQRFALARPPQPWRTGQITRYTEYVGDLVEKSAACLFDDDVPGDSARIAWLKLIWIMLWRWLRYRLGHLCMAMAMASGVPTSFRPSWALQDANDLIIMITAWLWGSLSQVPAPKGVGKGGVTIQHTSQVPHIPQLWQLVHVLDRASVLSFLYSHSAQLSEFYIEYRYNEEGPTMPIVVESALGTATDDYDPSEYCGFTGKNSQGEGDSGLLQLRKAFPGAMKVLDICFLWQTEDAAVSKRSADKGLPFFLPWPDADNIQLPAVQRTDYPDARRSRSYSFMKAAAVHLSVYLLCEAVRRRLVMSFVRKSAVQVHSHLTLDERMIARAAVEDVKKVDQADELDQHHTAGCLPCKGASAAASRKTTELSDLQFWHVYQKVEQDVWLYDMADRNTESQSLQQQLMDPDGARALHIKYNKIQQTPPATQPEILQPFLVAFACSIISLIVSASTGARVEVDDQVAKLPAMERDEHVGNARLALIGIADLHKQLSRVCTSSAQRCTKPHSGEGSNRAEGHPCMPNGLDVACKALVKAADRLVMHTQYMYGCSLYLHQRSIAALVQPAGPLCKGEGQVLNKLLRFFRCLPEALITDVLRGLPIASLKDDDAPVCHWATFRFLTDFEFANISLAMTTAFSSIMASTGSFCDFSTPAPNPSPRPSANKEQAMDWSAYHRRMLVALNHAVCTAWEWLNFKGKQLCPRAGSKAVKAWGILQLSCLQAATSAAEACAHEQDLSNPPLGCARSGPNATSGDQAQAGTPQAPSGSISGSHTPSDHVDSHVTSLTGASALVVSTTACACAASAAVFTSQALSVALTANPVDPFAPSSTEEITWKKSKSKDQGCHPSSNMCKEACIEEHKSDAAVWMPEEGTHLAQVVDGLTLLLLGVSVVIIISEEGFEGISQIDDGPLRMYIQMAAQQDKTNLINSISWLCNNGAASGQNSKIQACLQMLERDLEQLNVQLDAEALKSVPDQWWNALSTALRRRECLHQAIHSQGSPRHKKKYVGHLAQPLVSIVTKMLIIQPASTTSPVGPSSQAPPTPAGGISAHKLETADLVSASQVAAEWAEACQHPRDHNQAALAIFWAAYLHTLMARKAYQVATAVNVLPTTLSQRLDVSTSVVTLLSELKADTHARFKIRYTDVPSTQSKDSKAYLRTLMANMAEEPVALDPKDVTDPFWTFLDVQGKAMDEWHKCRSIFSDWEKTPKSLNEFSKTSAHAAVMCKKAAQDLLCISRMPITTMSQEKLKLCRENALQHSRNAAEIASVLVQVAVKKFAQPSPEPLKHPIEWESHAAQHLNPAAAAKALGAISRPGTADLCQIDISRGESSEGEAHGEADMHLSDGDGGSPAATDAAAEDPNETQLTGIETALQQELHGAGVVVGFRLCQLFRRLLRDRDLMQVYRLGDMT